MGILTKVFCNSDPNLVILAWRGDELLCEQFTITSILWYSSEGIIIKRYQLVKQDRKSHFQISIQIPQGPIS